MNIRRILNEEFRVSPFYTLREWNVLNPREKELISGLHDEADVYGVFSPTTPGSGQTVKVAYHELALIYFHLTQSPLLPHYLTGSPGDSLNQVIAQLVLDQVLEIKWNEKFVSGMHATEALFGKALYGHLQVPGFISSLSKQGIEYALYLDEVEMKTIAHKLYTYNTTPWDSSLKRDFSETTDTRDYVFSASRSSLISIINKEWQLINDPAKDPWLGWSRRYFDELSSGEIDKGTYKLYISPVIRDLPKVMNVVLPILTASKAFSFKIGNGIQGLLRPDKMVAYFNNRSSMLQAAGELKNKFNDCKVQGVPFTAQIDDTGILSWGFDPPGSDVLSPIEGGSWRCKITDQIALAIMQAKTEQPDHRRAIDFIGSKLFVAGIDPCDWTPLN
jgi:hypothetical protein